MEGVVYTVPWVQIENTRKLLGQVNRSEKLQSELQSKFLFFLFEMICIFYTGSFPVSPEKTTPTKSANSHPKSQFDLRPSYINLLKNGSSPRWELWYCTANIYPDNPMLKKEAMKIKMCFKTEHFQNFTASNKWLE